MTLRGERLRLQEVAVGRGGIRRCPCALAQRTDADGGARSESMRSRTVPPSSGAATMPCRRAVAPCAEAV